MNWQIHGQTLGIYWIYLCVSHVLFLVLVACIIMQHLAIIFIIIKNHKNVQIIPDNALMMSEFKYVSLETVFLWCLAQRSDNLWKLRVIYKAFSMKFFKVLLTNWSKKLMGYIQPLQSSIVGKLYHSIEL